MSGLRDRLIEAAAKAQRECHQLNADGSMRCGCGTWTSRDHEAHRVTAVLDAVLPLLADEILLLGAFKAAALIRSAAVTAPDTKETE